MKHIPNLEAVETGVAKFIHALEEYERAGGTVTSDQEKKTDLLHILPPKQEMLPCGKPRTVGHSLTSTRWSSHRRPKSCRMRGLELVHDFKPCEGPGTTRPMKCRRSICSTTCRSTSPP